MDFKNIDCKSLIGWLKNQPTDFIEKMLKKVKLPTQLENIVVCRCIKQYSFIETCDFLHISEKQQKLRIRKIKQKINNYLIKIVH